MVIETSAFARSLVVKACVIDAIMRRLVSREAAPPRENVLVGAVTGFSFCSIRVLVWSLWRPCYATVNVLKLWVLDLRLTRLGLHVIVTDKSIEVDIQATTAAT